MALLAGSSNGEVLRILDAQLTDTPAHSLLLTTEALDIEAWIFNRKSRIFDPLDAPGPHDAASLRPDPTITSTHPCVVR